MKRVNSRNVLGMLLTICLLIPTIATAQTKGNKNAGGPEQTIMSLENAMKDAVVKGDTSVPEKYLASNYVRVYPDGSVVDRQQAINDLKSSMKYSSIEFSEQKVIASGNTAVSITKSTVKGTRDGQPIDGDYRGVRTWVKEGGQWKAVAFSTTKISTK